MEKFCLSSSRQSESVRSGAKVKKSDKSEAIHRKNEELFKWYFIISRKVSGMRRWAEEV